MRKYIIVRKFAWTSFWDISFGNRIRFWEFAQAINKINNYKDLVKLKVGLRNKIETSPIFDSDTFARNFEDLLLKIHN